MDGRGDVMGVHDDGVGTGNEAGGARQEGPNPEEEGEGKSEPEGEEVGGSRSHRWTWR